MVTASLETSVRIGAAASISGLRPGPVSRIAAETARLSSGGAGAAGFAAEGFSLPPGFGRIIVVSPKGSSSAIESPRDRPQIELHIWQFAGRHMDCQAAGAARPLQLLPERAIAVELEIAGACFIRELPRGD